MGWNCIWKVLHFQNMLIKIQSRIQSFWAKIIAWINVSVHYIAKETVFYETNQISKSSTQHCLWLGTLFFQNSATRFDRTGHFLIRHFSMIFNQFDYKISGNAVETTSCKTHDAKTKQKSQNSKSERKLQSSIHFCKNW